MCHGNFVRQSYLAAYIRNIHLVATGDHSPWAYGFCQMD